MAQMDRAQNGDEKSGAKKMLTVMLKEYLRRLSEGIRDLVIKIQQNEPLGEYEYQGKMTKAFRFYHKQIELIKDVVPSAFQASQIATVFKLGGLLLEIIPQDAHVAAEPQTQSSKLCTFLPGLFRTTQYTEDYINDISAKPSGLTTSEMCDITEKAIRAAAKIKA
jgi:hypothetical protein